MNEQDIITFTNLYIKFQERCKHIANILSEYDCDFKESRWNNWELDYDDCHAESKFDCYTSVDIIAYGCLVDTRNLCFPIELLTANDEQIHLYAQEKYCNDLREEDDIGESYTWTGEPYTLDCIEHCIEQIHRMVNPEFNKICEDVEAAEQEEEANEVLSDDV